MLLLKIKTSNLTRNWKSVLLQFLIKQSITLLDENEKTIDYYCVLMVFAWSQAINVNTNIELIELIIEYFTRSVLDS